MHRSKLGSVFAHPTYAVHFSLIYNVIVLKEASAERKNMLDHLRKAFPTLT